MKIDLVRKFAEAIADDYNGNGGSPNDESH